MYLSARISSWVLIILGWLAFIMGIIFMLIGGKMGDTPLVPEWVITLGSFVSFPGLILVALGEGLRMLVKIAENTQTTGDTLAKLRRRN